MKIIWKHVIKLQRPSPEVVLELTKNAEILSVANQHDEICLWECHDTEEVDTEKRLLFLATTGNQFNIYQRTQFLGTVLLEEGFSVIHVYECNIH